MEDEPIRYELWVPITIRVAWELSRRDFQISAELLENAREHVLRLIPKECTFDEAERFAILYVEDFVRRLNEQYYVLPDGDPDIYMPIPRDWRAIIERRYRSIRQRSHSHQKKKKKKKKKHDSVVRFETSLALRVRLRNPTSLGN